MNRNQSGYASILVIGMTMIAIGVSGLAVDGTRAFLFRRTLQNAADAAALAGASEIDRPALYSSGGSKIVIDADAARRRAAEWLARRGIRMEAGVVARADAVRVVLRGEVDTTFLRVVGLGSVPVSVEAIAEPVAGDG